VNDPGNGDHHAVLHGPKVPYTAHRKRDKYPGTSELNYFRLKPHQDCICAVFEFPKATGSRELCQRFDRITYAFLKDKTAETRS
jgi:hypothetical protein